MKPEQTVAVTHYVAGALAGASYALYDIIFAPLVLLVIAAKGTEMASDEKKDIKWWLTNGFPIFLLSFISVWIIFYNL